jgi:2-polyprenyl-6-methoxyphenol hydroxylase-like FAD-dependent oxidoreductase
MEEDIPESYRPDPPGNIEAIWHMCHTPITDLFPYPNNKSPIIPSTSDLDNDWLLAASRRVSIFMNRSTSPNIRQQKDEHIQFFFWTALDRSNRRYKDVNAPNARLWEFHDMHGMLAW